MEETKKADFNWDNDCFICNERANIMGEQEIHHVISTSTRDNILNLLGSKKDVNSTIIHKRLTDLDVVYVHAKCHQKCYTNLVNEYSKIQGNSKTKTDESKEVPEDVSDFDHNLSAKKQKTEQQWEIDNSKCMSSASTNIDNVSQIKKIEPNIEVEKNLGLQPLSERFLDKECCKYAAMIREGVDGIIMIHERTEEEKRLLIEKQKQRDRQIINLIEKWNQCQDVIRRKTYEFITNPKKVGKKKNQMLAEQKNVIDNFETEINKLRKELNDERMKRIQNSPEISANTKKRSLSRESDNLVVSEAKKVKLEATENSESLLKRVDMLENDNNRLSTELKLVKKELK